MSETRRALRSFVWLLVVVLIFAILNHIAARLTPLQAWDAYLQAHPAQARRWVLLVGGVGMLGAALLLAAPALIRADSAAQAEASPQRGFPLTDADGMREFKRSYHAGDWRRNGRWWRWLVMTAGSVLFLLGAFGLFAVLGAPVVKLIALAALGYVLARAIRTFWRA